MKDTIAAHRSTAHKRPITAIISDLDDDRDLFNIYLEFILFRIKTDIESYRKVLSAVPGHDVKHVLSSMATKKMDMHDTLISYRAYCTNDWFASAFGTSDHQSTTDLILDTCFKPLQSIVDAFHFAYRKEYESLNLFEQVSKLCHPNTLIRTMLESATEFQCWHILHLDAMLADIKKNTIPAIDHHPSDGDNRTHNDRPLAKYYYPLGRYRPFSSDSVPNGKKSFSVNSN